MSRPKRIDYPGAFHHVLSRINNRISLLKHSADKESFIKHLIKTVKLFDFKLHAFCIMDNHFHLIIESGKVLLSRVMQYIIGNFTKEYNKKHNKVGHLFQGRFKSYLIDAETYFLELTRYILNNPVRAGIVKLVEEYQWGSFKHYFSKYRNDFIEIDLVRSYFKSEQALKRFINESNPSFKPEPERIKNIVVFGSKGYIETIMKKDQNVKEQKGHIEIALSKEEIMQIISTKYYIKPEYLLKAGQERKKSRIRKILAFLFRKYFHMTLRKIGAIIHTSESNVSLMINSLSNDDRKEIELVELEMNKKWIKGTLKFKGLTPKTPKSE